MLAPAIIHKPGCAYLRNTSGRRFDHLRINGLYRVDNQEVGLNVLGLYEYLFEIGLMKNVEHFRKGMMAAGFDIKPTQSAICAVMLYDAKLSQDFAARLQDEGIFVTGFYYPVVPKGQARIRVQVSAGHTTEQLDRCIAAFVKIGKEMNVIK